MPGIRGGGGGDKRSQFFAAVEKEDLKALRYFMLHSGLDVAGPGAADDDACSESAARTLSRIAAHADRSDSAEATARSPEDRTSHADGSRPRPAMTASGSAAPRPAAPRLSSRSNGLGAFAIRFSAAALTTFECAARLLRPEAFASNAFGFPLERPLISS